MVKKQPVLITDAAHSLDDQLRTRQRRYIAMMSIRAGCLIVGAVLISVQVPLLPLWLALCALGMVLLPWMAVIIANDRPPKSKLRRTTPASAGGPRALSPESAEATEPRTIDAES